MRKSLWLALSAAPYAVLGAAAVQVGLSLAARDPGDFVEGKGIYAGFFLLSLVLAISCLVTAGVSAVRWRRSLPTDPAVARFYRNIALVSTPGVVLFPLYGALFGLGLAYAIATVA